MADFTIAIPTYNGEHRLPAVLERLRSPIHPPSLSLEILVIDNNSRDRTAAVVQFYQSQLPFPVRYLFERRQGAAFARQRAIQEATGELIGFLDDDNLPASDWVAAAWSFAQSHPRAGAWGSRILGDFEVLPPAELKSVLPFLAIVDRGSHPLLYHSRKRVLPPSAGLVVRRSAWLASVPTHPILSGRTQGSMLTGEDTEALAHLQRRGWEIWYNPAMQLTHVIPHWRLERGYLLPFFRGIGLSRYVTRTAGLPTWQVPWVAIAYLLNDLRQLLLQGVHQRLHPPHNQAARLAQDCRWELLKSSLVSPFYLYQKGYLRRSQPPFDRAEGAVAGPGQPPILAAEAVYPGTLPLEE